MARREEPKSKVRRTERNGVLGEEIPKFSSPPARGLGERCKLPEWGPG